MVLATQRAPAARAAGAAAPLSAVATPRQASPSLGFGVGLRRPHFQAITADPAGVDFVEIVVENFLGFGGPARAALEAMAAQRPVVMHGLGLSIGSPDPLDLAYVDALNQLAADTGARWTTDHLSYSSAFGVEYHDLLPLPFTEAAVEHVVRRVELVQARLDVPFALENPSYYLAHPVAPGQGGMTEAEFVRRVVTEANCGLLLDVNNVYVNAHNHGYDPRAFIDTMPLDRVIQLHVAGHVRARELGPDTAALVESTGDDLLIDTHGAPIADPVFDLLAYTLERTGPVSVLLERDHAIPSYDDLRAENERVRAVGQEALRRATQDASLEATP